MKKSRTLTQWLFFMTAIALCWCAPGVQAQDAEATINNFLAEAAANSEDEDWAPADPDAIWDAVTEWSGAEDSTLELDADQQQLIYDKVWTNSSELTPWLTHNIWILIAALLVLLMHLGFSTLESGLTQQKNTVNVLFKNVWIICIGILSYYLWGFNAHYPGDDGWLMDKFFALGSLAGFGPNELLANATNLYYPSYTLWTDFIFQAMFAATAATIVSGAVAERVKLTSFMIFAVILVGFAYPWVGSWHWGGGLLAGWGFYDFAGSSVVHAFGGFAALACVIVLGPRMGKYTSEGIRPILGHSMPLAVIGVFLLFLGWFGFNGGSVLAAEPYLVSLVFVTTALAAVSGGIAAIATSWALLKKPDLSMALNGILAGLVAITAGADSIAPGWSIVTGAIGGILVVVSILFLDKIRIDDPVGAISVHGTCGIWGTVAVGIFGGQNFMVQLGGSLLVCAVAFAFSFIVFFILRAVMGVRVSEEEESAGLDIEEHGSPAYTGFH